MGLCENTSKASDILWCQLIPRCLTTNLHSSVIKTLDYNNTKYSIFYSKFGLKPLCKLTQFYSTLILIQWSPFSYN